MTAPRDRVGRALAPSAGSRQASFEVLPTPVSLASHAPNTVLARPIPEVPVRDARDREHAVVGESIERAYLPLGAPGSSALEATVFARCASMSSHRSKP